MSGELEDNIGECTTVCTATGEKIDMPVWIMNTKLQDISLKDNGDGIAYCIEEGNEKTVILLDETERGIIVAVENQTGDGDTDVERVNDWYYDFIGIAIRRLYEKCGVDVKGLSFGLTYEDFDPFPKDIAVADGDTDDTDGDDDNDD